MYLCNSRFLQCCLDKRAKFCAVYSKMEDRSELQNLKKKLTASCRICRKWLQKTVGPNGGHDTTATTMACRDQVPIFF